MTRAGAEQGGRQGVSNAIIAASLLAMEFIVGMQTYVLRTALPIVGSDLDAHQYYGVIVGTFQIAMFLTMPLGPYLLQRFRVDRVFLYLTWVSVAGGVISAVAPSTAIFVLGRAIAGLAGGATSTVSLAAIVTVLPPGWRRAVLAGYNVMWVCTSLLGPLYGSWVASALSWRWALVLYLPLMLVARIVLAHQLKGTQQSGGGKEPLPLGSAALLAGGVALVSVTGIQHLSGVLAIGAGLVGTAAALAAARVLLPEGTMRIRRGRPAAVATMGVLTGSYFGAAEIVSIVVHDILGGSIGQVGVVLAGSGIAWAVAGLAVSRWPAKTAVAYARRSTVGAGVLAVGLLMMAAAVVADDVLPSVNVVLVGWTAAGAGMGMLYLDTLNHIVEVPPEVDGVSGTKAAAAAILVEAIATAVMTTFTTAAVGRAIAAGGGAIAATAVLALTVLGAVCTALVARRAVTVQVPH